MDNFEIPGFNVDPIQNKLRQKLEASGVEFATENGNRLWTDEEWFQNKYVGQPTTEFPERIFKDISPDRILELKEKYKDQVEPEKAEYSDGKFDF